MLKKADIFKSIVTLLKNKYKGITIYSNEVVEGFKQPCFFIKFLSNNSTETRNLNSNRLTIIITYFPSNEGNKQLAFLTCEDTLKELFKIGFYVGERYLHVTSVDNEMIGEEQDILQVMINVNYLDTNDYDCNYDYGKQKPYDIMQELHTKIN